MKSLDDIQYLIYDALTQLGWETDAKLLAEKIIRLNLGLPKEDEFSLVCTWLGKCSLIHKLDQHQAPQSSSENYQIPDLLAIFNNGNKEIPVLIEVKSCLRMTLSFKADYFKRLQNYANSLKIPLLIAWKYKGMWALFDLAHMKFAKKNYNINFLTALKENLLGILAGDFNYTLKAGTGFHVYCRKDKILKEKSISPEEINQYLKVTIVDTFYTDGDGKKRKDLPQAVDSLIMAHTLMDRVEDTETHITLQFVINKDESLFAHMALVRLLSWQTPQDQQINWRSLIRKAQPLFGIKNFRTTVDEAMKEGLVKYILEQQPVTMPKFISVLTNT